jgi:hypothetical protein
MFQDALHFANLPVVRHFRGLARADMRKANGLKPLPKAHPPVLQRMILDVDMAAASESATAAHTNTSLSETNGVLVSDSKADSNADSIDHNNTLMQHDDDDLDFVGDAFADKDDNDSGNDNG